MVEVLTTEQHKEWNDIVKTFNNWEVYFLCEYAISLEMHGDGRALLFYFKNDKNSACFVTMVKDIADCSWAKLCFEKDRYLDMETPYGYGGALYNGIWDMEAQKKAYKELEEYCKRDNIVSYFIRFSPWLKNMDFLSDNNINDKIEVRREKSTVYIDTVDEELIFSNMDSKNRNMIRKAQKNGVEIFYDKGNYIDEFIEIYNSTMDNHDAENYFYFEKEYFEYLKKSLSENIIFFYSKFEEKIIGSAIFLYNNNSMHYHLSGTLFEYRRLASTNLLIFEAANWANSHGINKLHLGGGLRDNDSLFGFKKQFNKKGYLDFTIGRMIFDTELYNDILMQREKIDEKFDKNNSFLIQYRR